MDERRQKELFISLIQSVASNAIVYLGLQDNPLSNKKEVNLDQARFSIDLLQVLYDKTANNRSADETNILEKILSDLKMQYIQIKNKTGNQN